MLRLKWDIESRIDIVPIWIIHGNSIGLCHSFYGFYHVFVVEFDLLSCISLMKYWINSKMFEFYIYRLIEWLRRWKQCTYMCSTGMITRNLYILPSLLDYSIWLLKFSLLSVSGINRRFVFSMDLNIAQLERFMWLSFVIILIIFEAAG